MDFRISHYKRGIKSIKVNFILGIALVISQISLSNTSDVRHSIKYSQLDFQNSTSQADQQDFVAAENQLTVADENPIIQQKINQLINRISKLIEKVRKELPTKLDVQEERNCTDETYSNFASSVYSSDVEKKIKELEDEIKEMEKDIDELKNSAVINKDTAKRLADLERTLKDLYHLIHVVSETLKCQIDELMKMLNLFSDQIKRFRKELTEINETVKRIEREQRQRRLREQAIENVKAQNYAEALKKLEQIDGNIKSNINTVVHEVLNNNLANFELILPLGEKSMNTTLSLAIFSAIDFEMDLIEQIEPVSYLLNLRLTKSLRNYVIDKITKPTEELKEANALRSKLRTVARDKMIPLLQGFFGNENYAEVSNLFNEIDMYEPLLFRDDLLKPAFDVKYLELPKLVKFFTTHKNVEQAIIGCSVLLLKCKEWNVMDGVTGIVTLAFAVGRLLPQCSQCHDAREAASRMKDALPKSVRNLAFSNRVCFRNVNKNEYMYAANDGFKPDGDRRSIFSWVPENQVAQGIWAIEPVGETYYIKNTYHNEYLYASDVYYSIWHVRKYVFTWVSGVIDSDQFDWYFEPIGDAVYIRSNQYSTVLFADPDTKYDNDRRYVFVWADVGVTDSSKWMVENCD